MKRSKKAALVLMVPAATLLLAGCGEEREQAMVFSTPEECAQSSLTTAAQCEADFANAKALHPHVAPKYISQQECEADFGAGQCETAPQQTTTGHSVFMPMMMGYLAGQMMNSGAGAGAGAQNFQQAGRSNIPTQPLYKSRDDRSSFRTATNTKVAQGIGPITLRPSQVTPQVGQLVRRGGFGQQAARRAPATGTFGG